MQLLYCSLFIKYICPGKKVILEERLYLSQKSNDDYALYLYDNN